MKSFQTAFKSVYEKGLMQYGFRKVKGKYPYYARCIGDEIVHVITFREECSYEQSRPGVFDRQFAVLFGVATVYRRKIAFDEQPKWSQEWLNELSDICYKENYYPDHDRRAYEEMIPFRFTYIGNDEDSMMEEIRKSYELTEKYAIPVLDGIKTLEDCMNYYFKYDPFLLAIMEVSDAYVMGCRGEAYNEGLLATVTYGRNRFEEFADAKLKYYEKINADEVYAIKAGTCGYTMEQHRTREKERMEEYNEEISDFRELLNPEWQEKVRSELEARKKNNTGILRQGGFDI